MFSRQQWRRAALGAAALVLSACGNDGTTEPGPLPTPSITISAIPAEIFASDIVTFHAVVKDAAGVVVPDAPITWSVSHPARAELDPGGVITFLSAGAVTITARSGTLAANKVVDVQQLAVQSITVTPSPLRLSRGDITPVGVLVRGQGGRTVHGRLVTLSSDNPTVAVVDQAGRVRAVSAGTAMIRATADGVTGTTQVIISANDAELSLSRLSEARLPVLVANDSVSWDGVREYHEVYLEGGTLGLSGDPAPRYRLELRYAEYNVKIGAGGQRILELRLAWKERDHGVVEYDARGDLSMTSELIAPLHHTAIPVSGGFEMRYRIPGENTYLNLFYRREP